MPTLNQVIGTILQDIGKAKQSADVTSKEIGEQYKKDGILKHFPIPRVEIKNLTIDLKFAVTNVKNNEIEIAVTNSELEKMPEANISSLQLNTEINKYQIDNQQNVIEL